MSVEIIDPSSGGPLSASDSIWVVETTTGSSNAFSGSLAVAPTLATGLIISWRVPSAPSGASTYNLNSLGAKDIYVRNAAAAASDLVANRDLTMRYDGTRWQIIAMGTLVPGDMPAPWEFAAAKSSGQSLTVGAYRRLEFAAATTNTGPAWSVGGTNNVTMTCLIAGLYRIEQYAQTSGSYFGIWAVFKNGAAINGDYGELGYGRTFGVTVRCAVSDTIEIYVYPVSGTFTLATGGLDKLRMYRMAS